MCESKCKITWVNRAYLGLLNNISPKKFKTSIHKSFFVISQLSRSIKSKQASQMPQFLNMVWIWNIILYKTTYILNLVFSISIVGARVLHKKLKEAEEMDK